MKKKIAVLLACVAAVTVLAVPVFAAETDNGAPDVYCIQPFMDLPPLECPVPWPPESR